MKKFYQLSYEQKDGVRRGTLWIEAEAPLSRVHELIRDAYKEPEREYVFQLQEQRRSIVKPVTEQYTVEHAFQENETIRYMVLTFPAQNYYLKTEKVSTEERVGASIEAETPREVPKAGNKTAQREIPQNKIPQKKTAQNKIPRKKENGTNIGRVVKVTLENTHPPVWRRIVLPSQISFADLHDILQIAFGWEDEHLHGFSFPANSAMEEEQEDQVCVDELLKECSWIRYTYDFGDCWQHKLVWENDMLYKARHAMVVKARGDHFAEDSGGIYVQGDETARIPANIEEMNAALERRSFPPMQTSEAGQELVDEVKTCISWRNHRKDFMKNIREILEMALELHGEAPSGVFGEEERWNELYGDGIQEYLIVKQESPQKISDFLEKNQKKDLNNYYKYLQIPGDAPEDEHELAVNIATFWREHPEYLLYLFEKEEVKELQGLSVREDGQIPLPSEDIVTKALAVGFAELAFEETEEPKKIMIRLSTELSDWLAGLSGIDTETLYHSLKDFKRRIGLYIQAYGLIEFDALYSMYCACWKEDIAKEEFKRRIYCQLRMDGIVNTGRSVLDEKDYVCNADLDFEKLMKLKGRIAGITDYAPWSRKELLLIEKGFAKIYPEWVGYYKYLSYWVGYSEVTAEKVVVEDYIAVRNGASVTELAELMLERRMCSTLDDYICLWQVLMSVSMCTGLPFLNGYTRIEYMDRPEAELISTNLFAVEKLSEKVGAKQHLYELPWKVQWLLYLCMMARKDRNVLKDAVRAAMAEGGCNHEVVYLVSVLLYAGGCTRETSEIMNELARKYTDPSVYALLGKLQDSSSEIPEAENFQPPKQRPVRNTAPKIGRNDKCPCGSGKKYKFCCGKN